MKDLKHLDLNLLKALDALLDERHVTRAAHRLGLSQPAMSAILTRLRDSFGDPLFVRAQRGVVPTTRALSLRPGLKQILGGINSLLQPVHFDPGTAALTFTIAATDYSMRAIGVPFITRLREQAPQIRVALVMCDMTQLSQRMERGEIDLALLTPESTPPELHARHLFDERYVCVLREGHPAAGGRKLSLKHFCALEHALYSDSGDPFRGITDRALAAFGRERKVGVSVQSFLVLPELLRTTDMLAVLPSRLVHGMSGLVCLQPPIEISGFSKIAAWHERNHQDSAQRWLRELLFDTCSPRRR